VSRECDWSDTPHPCGVGRTKRFPELLAAGGDVEQVHAARNAVFGLVRGQQKRLVVAPADAKLLGQNSRQWPLFTSIYWPKPSAIVAVAHRQPESVRGGMSADSSFRRQWLHLTGDAIDDVNPQRMVGLLADNNVAAAVGEPFPKPVEDIRRGYVAGLA